MKAKTAIPKNLGLNIKISKQNLTSIGIIVLLLVVLAANIVLFSGAAAKNNAIKGEIESQRRVLERYTTESRVPITEKSIEFLAEEQNTLSNIYAKLKSELESPLNKEIPQKELEPLQFKEKLIQTQKRLREYAHDHYMSLPDSLGFKKYETELTDPAKIPSLTKQLKTLEELIAMMATSKVKALYEIEFREIKGEIKVKPEEEKKPKAPPVRRPPEGGPMIPPEEGLPPMPGGPAESAAVMTEMIQMPEIPEEEIGTSYYLPLSFKIECTNTALIDFLYRMRASPLNLIVRDFDIETNKGDIEGEAAAEKVLTVKLLVEAVVLQ